MTVAVAKLSQVYPDLVQHMSDEDREFLAGALELRHVESGAELITHGETSSELLLVAEGSVGVQLVEGDETIDLGTRGAGSWVGELGVIEPGPASASVRAASDATLWVLSHEAFERMREENPCTAARVMEEVSKDVAQRLRTCNAVLFRKTDEGVTELVSSHEAPAGVVARLIHEIKDLFDLGRPAEPGDVAPDGPTRPGMSLQTFLGEHPSFGRLSEDDQTRLMQACDVKEYEDGHVLIREGDGRDAVYFILDGLVEVAVQKPKEASFATDRLMGPGEIIGLIAIVDRGKRSASCTARGPIKAAALSLEGVSLLMHTRAPISCAFQYALASQLAQDARNLNESLLHAAAHPG
jgi:CRP-like cAMP-binding protein